ncbi:MAG: N-acetylmuramoyl-L-alanine amidase [Chloroflexi bacterium]|nr:N-acetylmuramoyl-L-alanine amidase [Chloroflexota bacterium]
MTDLPEFEEDNLDQLVTEFTKSRGKPRGRAPITPEFEERAAPITAEMVGSQAWANERLSQRTVAEPSGLSFFRETWIAFKYLSIALLAALLVATIFSYWTPDESLSEEFRQQLRVVNSTPSGSLLLASTPLPTVEVKRTVGIIAGHSGPPQDESFTIDPGAICDENSDNIPELTELEINTNVARLVVEKLLSRGYEVELLNEFDDRLANYRADALLSIHTNDCQNYGFGGTGFNAVGPSSRVLRGADEALVRCVITNYERITGLNRHFGLTEDMTSYHTFREVSVDTPVAIIEIGFMFADRQFLVNEQDTIAEGIAQGMLCFLEPDEFYNASDVETGQ